MSLPLQLAALVAACATAATATVVEDCGGVLQMLQGRSDAELAARCRASFAPEVCREVGNSLGAQPWSSQRISESCSRFAAASAETDERGLEAAVRTKTVAEQVGAPAPLDEATAQKPEMSARDVDAPPAQVVPGGVVGDLIKKVREDKANEEAMAQKLVMSAMGVDSPPAAAPAQAGPGGVFGQLIKKVRAEKDNEEAVSKPPSSPLRTLISSLEPQGVAALEQDFKTSLAQKGKKIQESRRKVPQRLTTPLEKHSLVEPEPEAGKTQKPRKAPLRQATPLEKHGLAEPEPENVLNARLALRRAVERAERTLTKTESALNLFGPVGPLPESAGVSLTPLAGFALFVAATTFMALSVVRGRRLRQPARTLSSIVAADDALLEVEQEIPTSATSTVGE